MFDFKKEFNIISFLFIDILFASETAFFTDEHSVWPVANYL